ncbi:MAG TPA: 2-C-methyl-D-erythritol 4-phosphate cytidylyltransferase [Pseudonocardia sp.]|nr:2-C-methyl-D-erythritol 4-phosphate cytidylyltransferase [Pseudonocardia sp.]
MDVVAVVVSRAPSHGPAAVDDLDLLAGVPVVVRAVRGLLASGGVDRIMVLCAPERRDRTASALAGLPAVVHTSVESLREALHPRAGDGTGPAGGGALLVHDAARPLAPPELVAEVLAAVHAGHPVVVPALPLTDTAKLLAADGHVGRTPDRSALRVLQTPQGFDAGLAGAVLDALAAGGPPERVYAVLPDPRVHTVPGHPSAFPLRGPGGRDLAEVLLGEGVG